MSKVSALRKLGAAARVVGAQAGRNRTLRAFGNAVSSTARSFGHTLHLLWLEVVGSVFLAMAAFGAVALVREYVKYQAGQTSGNRLLIGICFTLTFAWFGVSSFWRVRRKSQRP